MKSIRMNWLVPSALIAAVIVMAGCASTSKAETKANLAAASVKPAEKTEVLDDKGAAFGLQTPAWLTAYLLGGNTGVQKLKEYKDQTAFVVDIANSSKDFALKWVTGTEGPRQVSAKISSTIAGNINSTMESDSGAEAEANVTAAANLLNNAAFAGLTKDADWWQQVRNTTTDAQEFRAYALYIIDTKTLDRQVAAYIQRFLDDKNRALSEAEQSIYKGLIESLLSSTIDLNT